MSDETAVLRADLVNADPRIRRIGFAELKQAIAEGIDDFRALPTHGVFICIIYPIVGIILSRLAFGYEVLPLLFPLAAGFALVGPLAALGLYELSRRREQGLNVSPGDAFHVFRSASIRGIVILGLLLTAIFIVWLGTANTIFATIFGERPLSSFEGFASMVLTTPPGWTLIIVGNAVGFLFAVVVLTISVVSFPLLLDRRLTAATAVWTSIRAVAANPVVMASWGLIVAGSLLIGSVPFFVGLAVVVPVLGHTTWHLYRKVVEP